MINNSRLYTAKQCRAIDTQAMKQMGLAGIDLMQRAAYGAFLLIERHWPQAMNVSIYCGPGNNGGDGYLLAGLLQSSGRQAQVFCMGKPLTKTAKLAKQYAMQQDIELKGIDQGFGVATDLIVDALFGSGLTRPIKEPLISLFDQIQDSGVPVFALDMPSGINSDTGAVMGRALVAMRTICFVAPKVGLYTADGPDYVGIINIDDLSIDQDIYTRTPADYFILNFKQVVMGLQSPLLSTHKGNMGHIAVVGGQAGMVGAPILAASAAARTGAGRVTLFTDKSQTQLVPIYNPVLMTNAIEKHGKIELPASIDSIVLGPGLGCSNTWSKQVFNAVIDAGFSACSRMVIDADGLNILSEQPQKYDHWVLTPHPKEASRLLQCQVADIQADRPAACREISQKYGGVCALKGHGTLMASSKGEVMVCAMGNWGMATAGSGDVLSGIIGALLGLELPLVKAAEYGVLIHAYAGDLAVKNCSKRGLIATDIIQALCDVFKQIEALNQKNEK